MGGFILEKRRFMDRDRSTCQFCGCNADARIRFCCAAGRQDDLKILAANALRRFSFSKQDIEELARAENNSTVLFGRPSGKRE